MWKGTWQNASWGTTKDIQPYVDKKFQNNILLTQTERLTINGRPANPKYARNKNNSEMCKKSRYYNNVILIIFTCVSLRHYHLCLTLFLKLMVFKIFIS